MIYNIEPSKIFGQTKEEIKNNNTKKPNLLISVAYDPKQVLYLPTVGHFTEKLRKDYDLFFILTNKEDEIKKYGRKVAKHAGKIDLYIPNGHGDPYSLELNPGTYHLAVLENMKGKTVVSRITDHQSKNSTQ